MAQNHRQGDCRPDLQEKIQLHPQWPAVQMIVQRLSEKGLPCYLVGGSVRDYLLGFEPVDLDLVTEAKPEQIQAWFPKVLDLGVAFGVSQVVLEQEVIDVATFRQEDHYFDGRHPEKIVFSTMQEDFHRRDFTINSLYLNLSDFQLFDFCGGIEDLHRRILRTVGNPERRFLEDHLRVLRAARFVAQFDLTVEQETQQAVKFAASWIQKLSSARITAEVKKGFSLPTRLQYLQVLGEWGLWSLIFPAAPQEAMHLNESEVAAKIQALPWVDFLGCLFVVFHSFQGKQSLKQRRLEMEKFFVHLLLLKEEKKRILSIASEHSAFLEPLNSVDLQRQEPRNFREFLSQMKL